MNIRANPELKFLLKYLLIGIAGLAFALWSVYDGLVKFPSQIPRAEAWEILGAEVPEGPVDDELWAKVLTQHGVAIELAPNDKVGQPPHTRRKLWKLIARENGWNQRTPKHDETVKAIQHKVNSQYLFVGIGVIICVPCLIWFFRNRQTWIESTDDGLRSSWGQELKCSQIKVFDKKKWDKKGIGVLYYEDDLGAENTFVLDDLKYDRTSVDQIVAWVESQIEVEQIINGLPEAALDGQLSSEEPSELDSPTEE